MEVGLAPFADLSEAQGGTAGPGAQGPRPYDSAAETVEGFRAAWGWIDAVIEVAHIINDKWDAVWEMPMQVFLTLLRYRRDRAEFDKARSRRAQH
jgi:hypothetical protein